MTDRQRQVLPCPANPQGAATDRTAMNRIDSSNGYVPPVLALTILAAALAAAGCAGDRQRSGGGETAGGRTGGDAHAGDAHAGDTQMAVKQGGGVPPQPARLDRADPPLVEAARSGDVKRVRQL